MKDRIDEYYMNEEHGITTLTVENKYGRFTGVSICQSEDEFSRFVGNECCEMQIAHQTLKAKSKALYQRYLGAYNAYKTLCQNYPEVDPVMIALRRQVRDAKRRYLDTKRAMKKCNGDAIVKHTEDRKREATRIIEMFGHKED